MSLFIIQQLNNLSLYPFFQIENTQSFPKVKQLDLLLFNKIRIFFGYNTELNHNHKRNMLIANNIVEVIQLMLAPGLMISACGLLLLGMNNKYSLVVNRIRLLNDEKRKLLDRSAESDTTLSDNVRLESISKQIEKLVYRVQLVKRAVQNYTIAVALFILTSILIGISYLFKMDNFQYLITIIFLLGMLLVLVGAMFAAYETKKGYEIINLEVNAE